MPSDHVDQILKQWHRERPDLDVSAMAIIGRIGRLERLIRPRLEEVFAEHGLESWEFDVLATLRRSGKPYSLTAGQLLDSMMIASGTMTNRLDRLEKKGLLQRGKDAADGRVVQVALTRAGLSRINKTLPDHARNETRIVGGLTEEDRQRLIELLRRLHLSLTT